MNEPLIRLHVCNHAIQPTSVKLTLFHLLPLSNRTASYVQPCRRSDPEINKCIKNSFNYIRPYIAKGLTELKTPPLEPLRIEELAMENNAGAVRIKALFTDIVALGAGNYTVKDVRSDVKKLRIDMSLGIPRVETRGKYEIIGNVLLLPVRSNGEFWTEFCRFFRG